MFKQIESRHFKVREHVSAAVGSAELMLVL